MAVYACKSCKEVLNRDLGALQILKGSGGGRFIVVKCEKCGADNWFKATNDDIEKRLGGNR